MRQCITDEENEIVAWFDLAKAERFDETTTWNGSNHISDATATQWDHQELFRSKSGRWVLHCWSQWQGTNDSWTLIGNAEAARWLIRCGYESHPACASEFDALEV